MTSNKITDKQIDARMTIEIIKTLQKYGIEAKDGVLFLRELSYKIERLSC